MTLRRLGTTDAPPRPAHAWTAVIVNYNGSTYLPACIEALQRSTHAPAEIIVVDNASSDDSLQELHAYPRVRVEAQSRNLGFAGGANAGLALVETDVALVMNPDVEVEPRFGASLLAVFSTQRQVGAAGALLLYPDDNVVQHAGGIIDRPLCTTRHRGYGERRSAEWERPAECEFVTGGAIGLRMEAVREVGGFDTGYFPVYYEDADLCVRLRAAGWQVQFRPEMVAAHHEGVTLQQSPTYYRFLHRNRVRFAMQHLNASEWSAFVGAEFARLRHALGETPPTEEHWQEHSGVTGLREALLPDAGLDMLPDGTAASESARAELSRVLDWVTSLQQPLSGMRKPGRWRGRFGKALMGDLHGALERQQGFNAAVVAALRTQEAVNREQIAQELVQLLNLVYRLEQQRGDTAPQPREATTT